LDANLGLLMGLIAMVELEFVKSNESTSVPLHPKETSPNLLQHTLVLL